MDCNKMKQKDRNFSKSNSNLSSPSTASGGSSLDDGDVMVESLEDSLSEDNSQVSVEELATTSRNRISKKKKKKKKKILGSDYNLLKEYLQEYYDRCFCLYQPSWRLAQRIKEKTFLKSTKAIIIMGIEFPRLELDIIQQPYLSLPSNLSGRQRRVVHKLCEDIGLFHCGVNGPSSDKERYVAISIYSDGLSYVPRIDERPAIERLTTFRPWVKRKGIDQGKLEEEARDRIYQLIDQPGKCLRDDADVVNLVEMEDDDLRDVVPPTPEDNSWMWIQSADEMQQCIQELHSNKPKEIAFDIECHNRSKAHQITCLIQLATDDGREYIIDVLADGVWDKVGGLSDIFADKKIVKIAHGVGGVDITSLHRDFGIFVVNLFDTLEAANAIPLREKGLAKICAHYRLRTSELYNSLKEVYQNTDWTRRPLTASMILYARYDVHYLGKLRRLMMRDLIKCTSVEGQNGNGNGSVYHISDLQALMRLCDDEDGIDDEDFPVDMTGVPDTDEEIEVNAYNGDRKDRTVFEAKDLRMESRLMRAISYSQDKCLGLWNSKIENHLKDREFVSLIAQGKKEGNEWTPSQLDLYDELVAWRERIAIDEGILPGFVFGFDFLARTAQIRPTTESELRQISYHLPMTLIKNNGKYLKDMFALIAQSRSADKLRKSKSYPMYEVMKPKLSCNSKRYLILMETDFFEERRKWFYYAATASAVIAAVAVMKMRIR